MLDEIAGLRELARAEGSWTKIDRDLGWEDGRQRRELLNTPGAAARAKRCTRQNIARVIKNRRPFPLPIDFMITREKLVEHKKIPGDPAFQDFLMMVHGGLTRQRPEGLWDTVSHAYVLGLALMSMALHHGPQSETWFGGPAKWPEHLEDAGRVFYTGYQAAGQTNGKTAPEEKEVVARLRPFLFINWVAVIVEQGKHRDGPARKKAISVLRKARALEALKEFLIDNPNLWQAAWNGVDLACFLQEDEEAKWFYESLKEIDRGFQSFDYSPGEVPSIAKDIPYFDLRFRTELHRDIP